MADKKLPGHRGKNRDYKGEYATYHGKKDQVKNRSSRNSARRSVAKKGGIPRGMEVDHRDGNPRNNDPKNLKVMTRRANRSKGDRKKR